jgi:ribosome maturation factor RimP
VEEVVMGPKESINELVEPLVAAARLELWDVELSSDLIRILVDRPGGVDLDTLDDTARAISAALDAHDELVPRRRYHLEVGSPGVERTLRTPDQFHQFVGTLVSIKTAQPIDGSRRFQGILMDADDDGVVLDATGPSRFTYDQIEKARTVLVWGPSPKPGRPSSGTPRSSEVAHPVPTPAPTKDAAP